MKSFATLGALFLLTRLAFAESPSLPSGVVNTQNTNDHPLSPEEALKRITVPEGFRVTLFAGEPDIRQPLAFDFDDRGRLWVIENFSYPDFKNEDSDRIVILTDRDGDGRFDERKVFLEGGHRLTGIVCGFGGVWVCSAPQLLFYPDANGDDVPDGKPTVILDGFTLKAAHNMVNGLAWGPDGWLYGRHGITAPSLVGVPGTPETNRVQLSCSIWRYHPILKIFEVVTHGTTNPWGLDWDEDGQAFFSNNVIGHFWHVIPGAHYKRMFGEDFNPHIYELMESASDHFHWAGTNWTKARGGQEHDALGGGHAHSGAMIYLGTSWPDNWRGKAFMGNIHGNRVLFDILEKQGSGYVARHGANFLMANDPWFRPIQISYGPDGGVYVTDWNDFGECHDSDGVYRDSGRIYKIAYGRAQPAADLDLSKLSDEQLAPMIYDRNEWMSRHARRLLQERAARGTFHQPLRSKFREVLDRDPDPRHKLRALWALHVTSGGPSGVSDLVLLRALSRGDDALSWWAIRLLAESGQLGPAVMQKLKETAEGSSSGFVRIALASALQRMPPASRWILASALVSHDESDTDKNLQLMIWYGIEPIIASEPLPALKLMGQCKLPKIREFITRRLAAKG